MYQITNARIITPFEELAGSVVVDGGLFIDILPHPLENVPAIDAGGLFLSPGFVDIHVHGGGGYSPMSGNKEDVIKMCLAHARMGTTSILPTTLAAPEEMLTDALYAIAGAMKENNPAFRILGAHMEGPALNPLQAGAQAPGALKNPSDIDLQKYLDILPEIRMMGAAPELKGGMALGEKLSSRGIIASAAHTNATYYEMQEALHHGYTDITHLYSACSGIIRKGGFRIPGVIEAGLNLDAYTVQVIGDGKHLPPELLQLIYRCKGAENIILITDGLEFAGMDMQEGTVYTQQNGVQALYEDGVMKLTDRTAFAGSASTMNMLIRNMTLAGISLPEAVLMATENPARRIHASGIGRIQKGYHADFILFDENINVCLTAVSGKIFRDDRKLAKELFV
ncbi:MAG: amidohydrolase family protein [Clostridia bacterium]|nr:amidohydrolase family protein [Clostridia bacterium]